MNVLVISAHPDDEVLGPGGTLIKHTQNGDSVYSCILCKQSKARKNKPSYKILMKQAKMAGKIIGIKDVTFYDFQNIKMNTVPTLDLVQAIERVIKKCLPEVVYVHHGGDLNEDHRIIFNATMAAIRLPERKNINDLQANLIKEVYSYEVPSSTEWAPPLPEFTFRPNVFVDIDKTFKLKIQAIQQYKGVVQSHPHPRSLENIEALAKYRGSQSSFKLAEAFMLIKSLK